MGRRSCGSGAGPTQPCHHLTSQSRPLHLRPMTTVRPPAPPAAKSAIATSISRKRTRFQRAEQAAEPDDDPEADAAMRAWLERAKWGHGPAR